MSAIANDHVIEIHYTLKSESGETIDSTEGLTPLAYIHGRNNIVPGLEKELAGKTERQYYFDLTPHQFPAEYEAACHYHQTAPQSIFTSSRIISRLTENHRVTLNNDRLIVTTHGQREEFPIQNEIEFLVLLKKHFDIVL